MAFNVRIFGYRGTVQIPERLVKQFTSDSLFVLDEPYQWGQLLVADAAAVSSAVNADTASAPDLARILMIEVPDNKQVRYEINPYGPNAPSSRTAGENSPIKAGRDFFHYTPGMTISIIDAAGLP